MCLTKQFIRFRYAKRTQIMSKFYYGQHKENWVDFAYRGCGRIFGTRRFRTSGEKRLDRMVCKVWGRWCRHRNTASFPHRCYRYRACYSCFDKADPDRTSLDGVLGILDRAHSTSCRNAHMGFCGAMGKLGRAACSSIPNRVASDLPWLVTLRKSRLILRDEISWLETSSLFCMIRIPMHNAHSNDIRLPKNITPNFYDLRLTLHL